MEKILVIDSTLGCNSRTLRLCNSYIEKYFKENFSISKLKLSTLNLSPLTTELLAKRNAYIKDKNFDVEMFKYANEFAKADYIIIAAPYYDLSFPASLKLFIENIMISGLVFDYEQTGCIGLCSAKELVYITTAGGYIGEVDLGYTYIQAIANMLGIEKTKSISAQALDIMGNDPMQILEDAIKAL